MVVRVRVGEGASDDARTIEGAGVCVSVGVGVGVSVGVCILVDVNVNVGVNVDERVAPVVGDAEGVCAEEGCLAGG